MALLDGPGFDSAPAASGDPRLLRAHGGLADGGVDRLVAAVLARGELVARLYGRRVEQLALPMRPLDVAHGMGSQVTLIHDRQAPRSRPPGCARCAAAVGTCSAGATRRAPCPGPTARASMSPSRWSRATSRCSSARRHRRRRARPRVAGRPLRSGRRVRRGTRRPRTTPPACRCTRRSACTSTRTASCAPTTSCASGTLGGPAPLQARTRTVTIHTFHLAEVPALRGCPGAGTSAGGRRCPGSTTPSPCH